MTQAGQIRAILFMTPDPTIEVMPGQYMPALTTLLHRVCNNDEKKFEEATRLVELFIKQALEYGRKP